MRNPDLPRLLREVISDDDLLEQAAIELEKLEKIYKLVEEGSASEPCESLLKDILDKL